MGMTIDELKCIIGEYKLRIPPTVYYELLADLEDAEFIPKADYENRLKAEKVAMLDEIREEIEELDYITFDGITKRKCLGIIDKYKAESE